LASSSVRSYSGQLSFLVMLKTFQRLGYFCHFEFIPHSIIDHIRTCLKLDKKHSAIAPERSRRRYSKTIKKYLNISTYNKQGQKILAIAVGIAATVRDHPADLINVAIEELVKERYELPAFSTLDRLVLHIRAVINNRLFKKIARSLSLTEISYLDGLLIDNPDSEAVTLNEIKQLPKKATLSQIKKLLTKFERLMAFGDAKRLFSSIATTKIKHFAAYARTLDSAEFQDIQLPKRRTLLLSLLYQSQVQARDNLVLMFLKRLATIHNRGKERLELLREEYRATTEALLGVLGEIIDANDSSPNETVLGRQVQSVIQTHGGSSKLRYQWEEVTAYNNNNYLPLLWQFYSHYRASLFKLIQGLELHSTTQDQSVMSAVTFLLDNEHRRGKWLPPTVELDFVSEAWRKLILTNKGNNPMYLRCPFEICIFSYLATDLKTGDICVEGSESFADYRCQLLSWEQCQQSLPSYCEELGFDSEAEEFVTSLKTQLSELSHSVDLLCQQGDFLSINENGEPVLKKIQANSQPKDAAALEKAILQRMPERSILDILCNVEHWLNWTRHFGMLSGSEPKIDNSTERYILTTFAYGCNLGANQMARHAKGKITSHMLSYTNRRHISAKNLEAAIRDIINSYNRFNLPKIWGTGKRAAADGTKFNIYENNLVAEYHIRYGGYGGIAYHHVSDNYIALFTHFITCGVWEAVYILDGLLKNTSDIQPDTLHADTQGQSSPVFALAHLLGIKLMPRIRNWKGCTFYRASAEEKYQDLEPLFGDVINWELIKTHWQDLMRVVLSIRAGKLMPSTILRKLGTYSRKNRLYQAFRELGRVVRTMFLLQYISDMGLRRQITAITNIVEAYNGFSNWLFFGKDGLITDNDPIEQEKRLKYLDLVANSLILQNAFDISSIIRSLSAEGYVIKSRTLATLSPYLTGHLKRYGDYVVDFDNLPQPLETAMVIPLEPET
jgi:TnpA family transposase